MSKTPIAAALLAAVLAGACAAPATDKPPPSRHDRATLGDGGVSPFYRYDSALPQAAGRLLRQEPLAAHQRVPGAATNLRLLYTSTDGIGGTSRIAVSGALFLPPGTPPAGGWPLLLWSHGTVGIADICAPSWTGYVPFHQAHLQSWIERGYAIVTSDYQGLGTPGTHPYMATRPEAYSNLDAIRAVQSANFPVTDSVLVAGQSQGAGAAIATAGYARTYAPELDLRAVIATGVPYFSPEAVAALRRARPRDVVDPKLGYNFLVLSLLDYIDPTFDSAALIRTDALPVVRSVATVCNRDMRRTIEQLQLTHDEVFKAAVSEQIAQAYQHMGFPTLALPIPLFVGTGSADADTPPRMQAQFAKAACAAGTAVSARVYAGFDHLTALNRSLEDSTSFAAAAFSGAPIESNCATLPYDSASKRGPGSARGAR